MREIDFSKPLSDEDREYLRQRGKEQLVDRLDAQQGDEEAAARVAYLPGTATDNDPAPVLPLPESEPAEDGDETDDEDTDEPQGTEDRVAGNQPTETIEGKEPTQPDADQQVQVDGDGDDADGDDEEGSDEDLDGDNYPEWTNKELKAELKNRELPTSGDKDELVARLRENDALDEDASTNE